MDCKRRFYVLYGFGVANVPATRRGRLETLAIAAVLFSSPYPLLVAVSSPRSRIGSSAPGGCPLRASRARSRLREGESRRDASPGSHPIARVRLTRVE